MALVLFLVFVFLVFPASLIQAQSGRARSTAPPPSSTPSERPASASPTKPNPTRLSILVTKYIGSANLAIWTDAAFRGMVQRLTESLDLIVEKEKELTRKQAIDLAKMKTDQYILWIKLEVDVPDTEKAAITPINPGCLVIFYELFTPDSGKVKTLGKVYQPGYQSVCTGGVYNPSPFPSGPTPKHLPAEMTVKQAGRETADRIITALDLPLPRAHP
jgi:hypothetical protein